MSTGKTHLAACLGLVAVLLAACSSAPKAPEMPDTEKAMSMTDKVLEKLGIKKPEAPELPDKPDVQLPDRRIRWRLAASDALNLNAAGQPVALLTRIYKLKNADAFMKAPYETFGDAAKEKEALGEDLLESRDLQLIPGQRYEQVDKVTREAGFVGIVALYRTPAGSHWRYAFKAGRAELSGISMGLHACAMSVHKGEPVGLNVRSQQSVAIPCPKPVASVATREIQP